MNACPAYRPEPAAISNPGLRPVDRESAVPETFEVASGRGDLHQVPLAERDLSRREQNKSAPEVAEHAVPAGFKSDAPVSQRAANSDIVRDDHSLARWKRRRRANLGYGTR